MVWGKRCGWERGLFVYLQQPGDPRCTVGSVGRGEGEVDMLHADWATRGALCHLSQGVDDPQDEDCYYRPFDNARCEDLEMGSAKLTLKTESKGEGRASSGKR